MDLNIVDRRELGWNGGNDERHRQQSSTVNPRGPVNSLDAKIEALVMGWLEGQEVPWPAESSERFETHFLSITKLWEVQPIMHERFKAARIISSVPASVLGALKRSNLSWLATHELRKRELVRVVGELSNECIRHILFKGVPCAFDVYPAAHHRPSSDVDIFISSDDLARVDDLMKRLGYVVTPDMLFGSVSQQRQYCRKGKGGGKVEHIFEFHLELNNRPLLAPFRFGELWRESKVLMIDGVETRIPERLETFLIGALHRLGHLTSDQRFLWLWDLRLLVGEFTTSDWDRLVRYARDLKCGGLIVATVEALESLREGIVPGEALEALRRLANGRGVEVSRYYLWARRNRRTDLFVSFVFMGSMARRLHCLKNLVFPSASYLRASMEGTDETPLWLLHCRRWRSLFGG